MIGSLSLQGFKSFAALTRLEFGPGISAVIGPNGSGKSNVVEAIRWVTHNARARELRAARSGDLIFHGSGSAGTGRAPLGLAEVQLELRTPAGERVHLARRVYQDGTSEQDLAGRPARVRDVQSALRGTGLGSGGLAVIGQGEVSGVVQAAGSVLLAHLQEAAGLSRSVAARSHTAARLGEAATHLAQVRLLEGELEQRRDRLEAAAQAAARHHVLTLEVLTHQDALARARALSALAELEALRVKVETLGTESAALAHAIQDAARTLDTAREAARIAREGAQQHQQALELHQAAVRAAEQSARYLEHLDGERAALTGEASALPLTPPADPAPDLGQLQADAETAARTVQQLSRQVRDAERQLDAARRAHGQQAQQAAAQLAERGTLEGEAAHLDAERRAAETALDTARQQEARQQQLLQPLEAQLHALGVQRGAAQAQAQELASALRAAQASRIPLRRERERLESTLSSYARYGEGARNALQQKHPGIVGSVADLLSVPAEYETAVGAALGRRLEQVVVQHADDAREIIEILKRTGGRATFLPLDLLRPRPRRDAALLRERGVLGNLADLCPSDPEIVGQNLLSDTLLIQDLGAATALARRHTPRPRLVTLEGELLEPGGALTGGRLRDSGAGVLADQRRLLELDDELAALEGSATRLEREQATLSADLQQLGAEHERHSAAVSAARGHERAAQLARAEAEARHAALLRQHAALLTRLERPQPEAASTSAQPDDLSALEAALELLREQLDASGHTERAAALQLARGRELAAAWKSLQAALLRAEALQARLSTNLQSQGEQRAQLVTLQAEVQRRRADLGDFDPAAQPRAEAAREQVSAAYSAQIARQNRLQAQLDEARLMLARREGSLPGLQDGALPPGQPREWQAALTRAQSELEALGPVNGAAAQELAHEAGRLAALVAEREDAQQAAAELETHLLALEDQEAQATDAAYRRVARAFTEYSAELLGGEGELVREYQDSGKVEDSSRVTGLRLAVQPRGKRTRNLTLLSTGERTMAGLAFLFALGHAPEPGSDSAAPGLPLAVLDEVDAPLDEANIRRFTHFLTLFAARGSQFLLVTHQKATMEVATALWGVTTDGSGASRVLSIRQAEDERVAG